MNRDIIGAWFRKITVFLLCATIFIVPFSISFVEIFFWSTLTAWAISRILSRPKELFPLSLQPVKTKLNLPIFIFVLVAFLSVINSDHIQVSLKGFIIKLFKWVMVYFIIVEAVNDKKRFNRIVTVILFSTTLVVINGLIQSIRGSDLIGQYSRMGVRISSSFNNPNGLGGWLIIMIPLTFALAYFGTENWQKLLRAKDWIGIAKKVVFYVLTLFFIITLVSTYSRGAWIATFLSLIFLGVFKDRKFLIAVIAIFMFLSFAAPHSVKLRAASLINFEEMKDSKRIILWKEALSIIKEYPVLGCGFNTYAVVGPSYRITESSGFYPHNSYLQMAAELGIFGLGVFLWLIYRLFAISLANIKKIKDRFGSAMLIGLLAGLFGFLAHSLVDTNIYAFRLSMLMWFTMGLIIAAQRIFLEA